MSLVLCYVLVWGLVHSPECGNSTVWRPSLPQFLALMLHQVIAFKRDVQDVSYT